MADDYKIKITTEGDPQGANKVADALKGVGKAAGEQAKATTQSAKGLNELGEASEKGAALGRLLGEVTRGNVAALSQLGAVLKASGAAVKTSVFGVVLIAATALFNFLPGLITRLKGTTDEMDEMGKKADHVGEALRKIGEAKSQALTKALTAIKDEAKGAADELDRVLALRARIDKAKGEDDVTAERKREDMALGARFTSALDVRDRTAAEAAAMSSQVFELERNAVDTPARRKQERAAMERELATMGPMGPATTPGGIQRNLRIMELSRRISGNQLSPESEAFIAEQNKLLATLRPLAAQAQAAAAEAEANFNVIGRGVVGIRPDGSAIPDPMVTTARGLEDRNRRRAAGIPDPVSNIAPPAMMTPESSFSRAVPEKNYEAIARALLEGGERSGAQMAQAMIEAVKKSQAAQVEAFREQLKALQR